MLSDPQLLSIEIFSPDDSYSDTQEQAADYQRMGVETLWITDSQTKSGRMCAGSTWIESGCLEVPGTPIYAELEEILSKIQP